jgi:23S rRNA (cytosine1962-C5)-methyltransferase
LQDKFTAFENRLTKVYKHLGKLARKQQLSCFRVYDIDLPEFPFIIDVYKDVIYVAEYKSRHKLDEAAYENWLNTSLGIIRKVFSADEEHVFLKLRERQKGEKQYSKITTEKKELIVDENGLSFIVNLSDYLDTGLFLDHRLTRQKVREMANGKRVLNLFSYTGSFTVYAASGNAAKITTVDLSKTYINWAKRNLNYNKLYNDTRHEFIQEDVLQFLKTVPPKSYDLVILDPPTFSNSKRMEDILDIQRDHKDLINQCLTILDDKGVLLFSTNYRNFELDAAHIHSTKIRDISRETTPFDFEGKLKRKCYLIER